MWRPIALVAFVLLVGACGGDDSGTDPALDAGLIRASARGDADAVRSLLERDASVEARAGSSGTALVAAAYGNHVEVARLLIDAGADVNTQDASQQSAFLIATSEVGSDPTLLELTLDAGADVDAKDSFNGTGLIRAAHRGYVEIVERLLATEIDIDHVNRLGWTALLESIILGDGGPDHTETVRRIVAAGADVDLADGEGVTPLGHAVRSGYDEIVAILRAAGAGSATRPSAPA
jgi:ankyrin repeat protein